MDEHLSYLQLWNDEADDEAEAAAPAVAAEPGNVTVKDTGPIIETAKPAQEEKPGIAPKIEKKDIHIKAPGGILGLLIFILFMIFAVMPTSAGQTRLQLIWNVLTKGGALRGVDSMNPVGGNGDIPQSQIMPGLPGPPGGDINSGGPSGGGWIFDPLTPGGWRPQVGA